MAQKYSQNKDKLYLTMAHHRVILEGATNARDLGGFPTTNGFYTRKNLFFRCDSTNRLTNKDISILKNRGIKTVIDLRSPEELIDKPSVFLDDNHLTYKNITQLNKLSYISIDDFNLGDSYIEMLEESKLGFGRFFQLLLQATSNGGCLFHCSAGKDRTGLAAMLLLMLADVPETIIIKDYHVSELYQVDARKTLLEELRAQNLSVSEKPFLSPEEAIKKAIYHINTAYQGPKNYLLSCGFKECDYETLKDRFLIE